MSTLLDKLAQKKAVRVEAEAEKLASANLEQIFVDAFVDEFAKISGMEKNAALGQGLRAAGTKAWGLLRRGASAVGSAFTPAAPTGGQIVKLHKGMGARPAPPVVAPPRVNVAPEFKAETPGSFPVDRATLKLQKRQEKFHKFSFAKQSYAVGPLIGAGARLLPAIGAIGRGLIGMGAKGAPSAAYRVGQAAGWAPMAGALLPKRAPRPQSNISKFPSRNLSRFSDYSMDQAKAASAKD